jgi:hypothetical protein
MWTDCPNTLGPRNIWKIVTFLSLLESPERTQARMLKGGGALTILPKL